MVNKRNTFILSLDNIEKIRFMKKRVINFIRKIFKVRLFEKYLVQLTIDKPFGSLVTKLPPNHYQYPKKTIRTVNRHGINYTLDLSDVVDWYVYFGFQEVSRETLLNLMDIGQTIIDIGANIGNVTLESAKIVGPTGEIHSFEPDPENYKRLEVNLKMNRFSNISSNKLGLGNKAGVFRIVNVSPGNQGMNRIINKNLSNFNSRQIQVTTLDEYVFEKKLNNIDLIKIDVEGFEYNVLKGGVKVIDAFHPTFFIELDDNNLIEQDSSAKDLIKLLEDFGYEITHSESKRKIDSESKFINCHFDIIANYIA